MINFKRNLCAILSAGASIRYRQQERAVAALVKLLPVSSVLTAGSRFVRNQGGTHFRARNSPKQQCFECIHHRLLGNGGRAPPTGGAATGLHIGSARLSLAQVLYFGRRKFGHCPACAAAGPQGQQREKNEMFQLKSLRKCVGFATAVSPAAMQPGRSHHRK